MDINGLIENVLAEISFDGAAVPYYFGMPEVMPNTARFLVYDITEKSTVTADNTLICTAVTTTINIFCDKSEVSPLREAVLYAFTDNKFVYIGGSTLYTDKTYPFKMQSYQEFCINIRR